MVTLKNLEDMIKVTEELLETMRQQYDTEADPHKQVVLQGDIAKKQKDLDDYKALKQKIIGGDL